MDCKQRLDAEVMRLWRALETARAEVELYDKVVAKTGLTPSWVSIATGNVVFSASDLNEWVGLRDKLVECGAAIPNATFEQFCVDRDWQPSDTVFRGSIAIGGRKLVVKVVLNGRNPKVTSDGHCPALEAMGWTLKSVERTNSGGIVRKRSITYAPPAGGKGDDNERTS